MALDPRTIGLIIAAVVLLLVLWKLVYTRKAADPEPGLKMRAPLFLLIS